VPVPNPNVRGLYLESRWVIDRGQTGNDVARASLAWALDLDRWGRHQLAGMVERGRLTAFRYPGAEILVDAAGVPIGNAANPENAANFVFRGQYVVPGNFDTYFVGKGTDDFTVVRDGRTFRNEFIYTSVAGGFITRRINTLLAATQSSFLDQRLIVTAGLRGDRIRFDQHGDTRLSADDPDVRAGRAIRNTVRFTSEVVDRTEFRPVTGTVGGVYHATRALSFFYNRANNNSQPPLNARVLPDERLPPPFDGESQDYGLMLNLLDGRAFLRATAFATSQLRSSGRAPNGNRIYGETYYGPEDFKADAFAGYRRPVRLGRRAGEFTAQLNVTNVTDEDVVMPLRYNALKSGYTRVLLFEPRRFRLTLGLGF
jgi:hypothetical protein